MSNPNNAGTPSTLTRPLLNIILVLIEAAISLILRFDGKLRKLAYPLAQSGTVVCIRTYLPHTEVYATFSYKGILLDDTMPINTPKANITINAYSLQIFNILTSHSSDAVNKLQIRGEDEQVNQLKAFLTALGIGSIIQSTINKLKGNNSTSATSTKEDKASEYKAKINTQAAEIDSLTIENRKLQTQVAELQSKQKNNYYCPNCRVNHHNYHFGQSILS